MKKYSLFSLICLMLPFILNAQQFHALNEGKQPVIEEEIIYEYSSAHSIQSVYSAKELLAPRPHYTNFDRKGYNVVANFGVSQGGLRMNKADIVEVITKPSPLINLSLFKHKAGVSFQTGLGLTQHRFEVETISATDRKLNFLFLDIPLLARYHFSPAFFASGGIVPAINLSTRADFDFDSGRPEEGNVMKTKHDTVKNSISNVRIFAGYLFPSGLSIQGTYTKAMGEILKDGSDGKTFGYVDLQIGYVIFSKGKSK